VTRREWSPLGPRLYYALPLALPGLGAVVVGLVADGDLVVAAVGLVLLAVALRAERTTLVLEADHALVRNPYRTYRLPYGTIEHITEETLSVLGSDERPWVGTRRLHVETTDRDVVVEATGWLPASERKAIRGTLLRYARTHASAAEDLDTREPYAAVLRVLEDADPNPALERETRGGYREAAEEIAAYLRDDPVGADEVAEILDAEPDEALTRRLNALR
jgi:hypothetical protein